MPFHLNPRNIMNDAVTWLDLVVFILLAFFIVRGAWVGLIRQLAAFFALVGSYVIAARYVGLLLPWTRNFVDRPALVFQKKKPPYKAFHGKNGKATGSA